uniref:Seipin n=1 Tax=Angiostrongylus cantonensis TaxID=6313 RepID=A0A158P7X8_ANGCA
MPFWLVAKARVQLKRLSSLSKGTNPLHTAVLLFAHFSLAFFIAALTPLLIRSAALPSSTRNEIELNLSFQTCSDDLHGICSFPSVTLEYEKESLFSPSVTYALSIRLRFADIGREQKLEVFQNVISLYDKDDLLETYSKLSYLKKPNFLTTLLRTVFFPLYYVGLFYDYNTLDIPMTTSHTETFTKSSTKLLYQLQDRFAQVESAVLIVDARFGIIRHFLYNWPLTSSIVLFASSFSGRYIHLAFQL